MAKIAILGGGNIGEALLRGLLDSGMSPKEICVSNHRAERSAELKEHYGVVTTEENPAAVADAEVAFLCVKPKQILNIIAEIAPTVSSAESDCVLVSMAAGISIEQLEETATAGTPVIRVMPNTPMRIGQGMSALARGRFCDDAQVGQVAELLAEVGKVLEVAESDMDAVTAMSGSSPAYVFLFAEAMVDAGVHIGLKREVAQELAIQSLSGAAAMLAAGEFDPTQLRAQVSSPAGTTVAGIRTLEEEGIRAMVYRATEAVARRNAELS